jgi:16S rRNA processing protein RimM
MVKDASQPEGMIVLGRISGLYGVQGWVKVFSHTRPREAITEYRHWFLRQGSEWQRHSLRGGRRHGHNVVVAFEGVDDRDQAARLIDLEVAIPRSELPAPAPGEYYWADLIGLEVLTTKGTALGRVSHLVETGANDVLVVRGERERLIPFVQDRYVIDVDLEGGCMTVDWDPEF